MNNIYAEADEILRTSNKKAIVSILLSMQGNFLRAREAEDRLADKDRQLAEARAEIERKDKLIERLKCCGNCALKDLTAISHVLTHPYRDFCAVCKDRSKWHQTIENAALSAAERGK